MRATKILHPSSAEPLDAVLNECFILNHHEMIDAEFRASLESENLQSLRLAHGLMKRVGIESLKQAVEEHVTAQGTARVTSVDASVSTTLPLQYTEALSELHSKYDDSHVAALRYCDCS